MSGPATASDSFPRQYARTQRFTLGRPRSFAVVDDGRTVLFVRSRGGEDPVGCLWEIDVARGEERLLADPRHLGGQDAELPPEELARRERARESAGGIVAYTTDRKGHLVVFSLGGAAYLLDRRSGRVDALPVAGPVVAPRPDPTGARIAYVRDRSLWVARGDGSDERLLAGEDGADVTWGLPEFVAAEEMGRMRGFWWAPDGDRLVVTRVDTGPVQRWHLGDPAEPARPPATLTYPAAGTPNAEVTLFVVDLDGNRTEVVWDRERLPYLADVVWGPSGPLTLVVQSRDQRTVQILRADAATGATTSVSRHVDEDWVELMPGAPVWLDDGRLVETVDDRGADTRRITVAGEPVTPAGLQVRRLVDASEHGLTFLASEADATVVDLWELADGGLRRLTGGSGVVSATAAGATRVVVTAVLESAEPTVSVTAGEHTVAVGSRSSRPQLSTAPRMLTLGPRALAAALLLPHGAQPSDGPFPVLLDPYGGPHAQRVVRSAGAFLSSQWFADQGFAVLVCDGRGSPGRGPAWERTVAGDLATAPLEDQVDALHACADEHPGLLDLERVAIRGWSFGGFLAALAVLRRPDVFSAAIAGAPVTDWALYDTHYTERYLGLPQEQPDAYRRSSLLADAPALSRPLLLIHGLADDNVVAAHTLRLSRALLEAGRWHTMLPLSGVTHMTPQEEVAENLLHLQLEFLTTSLGR